jgi:adenine C2-methylase RlmN of 23S rRNA A2503 and tRNA A37
MIKVRRRDKNVEVQLVVSLHIPQQKQRSSLTRIVTCEEQWVVKTHCFKKNTHSAYQVPKNNVG